MWESTTSFCRTEDETTSVKSTQKSFPWQFHFSFFALDSLSHKQDVIYEGEEQIN